ncbi:MAG: hypothetical protein ACPGTS_00710 [Minisyncoccia bacterium]
MKLTATKRNTDNTLAYLRDQGQIPAIVYNKDTENIMVSVPDNMVRSLWKNIKPTKNPETGQETKPEFTLDLEGTNHTVILQDMQTHPVTGDVLHMDFLVK